MLFEPYQFKPCSHERRNAWKVIAENLNASLTGSFNVDARSVREKLPGIVVKYKQKNKDELNASGVSPVDKVLEEFSEKMEEADKLHNQTNQENAVTNAKKCLTRCSESPRKEAACIRDPC